MSLVVVALAVAASAVADSASPTGYSGGPPASEHAEIGSGAVDAAVEPYVAPEHLEAVTVGPEDVPEPVRIVLASTGLTTELGESGIPDVALQAYQRAAAVTAESDAGCGLRWSLLAAIGRVESNHGRFGGSMLLTDGYGTRPIRGIPLDGRPNVALIRDTDEGRLDGDTSFDRAVGPMQFIPSTWASVGVDANGDGQRDPDNIFDAAQGAAAYLCAAGGDLTDSDQAAAAVRRYNHADEYVRVVLALAASYERGEADTVLTALSLPSTEPAVSGPSQDDRSDDGPPAVPAPFDDAPQSAEPTTGPTPEPTPEPAPDSASPGAPTPAVEPTQASERPTSEAPPEPTPEPAASTDPTQAVQPPPDPKRPTPEPSGPAAEPTQLPEPSEQLEPTPSPEFPDVPTSSASPDLDDAAAIGWAPAMREVVVGLLAEPAVDAEAARNAATRGPDPADQREEPAAEPASTSEPTR